MRNRWKKGRNPFRLPLSLTFATYERPDGKWVSHALDVDLVSVGDTKDAALDKVRFSVKTYIEYGIMNNWGRDIIFPAPDEYWQYLGSKVVEMLPPIEIEDRRVLVYGAMLEHAPRRIARTA